MNVWMWLTLGVSLAVIGLWFFAAVRAGRDRQTEQWMKEHER